MAEQPGPTNHNTSQPVGDQSDGGWDENQGAAMRLLSQEGIFQLTQDLRKFSETLTSLKSVFFEDRESIGQSLRVAAHERLGELLKVLKSIVNKYSELNSTGILNAAEHLINHIKNFNYESEEDEVPPEVYSAINNLALAFSSSVSECLIGDINISPRQSMAQPSNYENVPANKPGYQRQSTYDGTPDITPVTSAVMDGVTPVAGSEPVTDAQDSVTDNLEICFERAKAWSKYTNDLLIYVKKKAHIEIEYAKQLNKLSQGTRAVLSEQSFLPFQSLYCTALDNDKEYASNVTAMYHESVLAHKFLEPLQFRRQEHDRLHKNLRDAWRKDKRWLEEAEANLKKVKAQYQSRNQEYQKAKDAAMKADQQQYLSGTGDGSHSRQGSGTGSSQLSHNVAAGTTLGIIPSNVTKAEKKKKQEDDSYQKARQAEQTYKTWVREANNRRREVEKREEDYLKALREMMTQCDQTAKAVTLNYFSLHCELVSPLRVQYQALWDESKNYEPGFQYTEYLRHVTPQHRVDARQDYQFEPAATEGVQYMEPSETSPQLSRASYAGRPLGTRRASQRGFSDTESSSSRSLDDLSPSASPGDTTNRKDMSKRRPSTEGSLSSEEILDEGKEPTETNKLTAPQAVKDYASYSPDSSPAPLRSQFQVPKMGKIVANVKEAFKGMKRLKATVFGVEFSVASQDAPDGIPLLVKKCIAEIDNRALTVKGIYRVNGVKNRIEKLCSLLDSPQCIRVDLTEHFPQDVAGVLKYFLRQLPEPLLMYKLYDQFLEVAKEYSGLRDTKPPEAVAPSGESTEAESDQTQSETNTDNTYAKFEPTFEKMRIALAKLPLANYNTLQYIIAHLSRVAEHHPQNMMTASNLAIIFGPTLLRPMPSTEFGMEMQSLIELPSQSHTIEMLISHRNKIFDTYSQKATNEDTLVQIKSQSSLDAEELQFVNHELDSVGAGSQVPKLLPLQSEPTTTVMTDNNNPTPDGEDLPANMDNHSNSGTSSFGDLFSVEENAPTSRFGQKDSGSGDSTTGQSNGGMNMIDDGRTFFPHSPTIKKNNTQQGGVLSEHADGRNSIRDDISVRQTNSRSGTSGGTERSPTGSFAIEPGRYGSPAINKGNTVAKGHTQKQENQQGNGAKSRDAGTVDMKTSDIPPVPLRNKSKRRSSDKAKPPQDLPIDQNAQTGKPISPHRPRSRRISGFSLRPTQDKFDISETSEPRRASVAGSPTMTSKSVKPQQQKRHSVMSGIIHPNKQQDPSSKFPSSLIGGRKLPHAPNPSKATSPTRSNIRPVNMPGRTPPFSKTHNWTFAKGDPMDIDSPPLENKVSDVQRKLLQDDDNEDNVSFC